MAAELAANQGQANYDGGHASRAASTAPGNFGMGRIRQPSRCNDNSPVYHPQLDRIDLTESIEALDLWVHGYAAR